MAKKKSSQEAVGQKRKLEMVNPTEGLPFVYANHVQIGQTAFDVRFLFGEMLEITPDKARILNRVHVTTSWLEAKILHKLLGQVLSKYETANGPISFAKPPADPKDSAKQ